MAVILLPYMKKPGSKAIPPFMHVVWLNVCGVALRVGDRKPSCISLYYDASWMHLGEEDATTSQKTGTHVCEFQFESSYTYTATTTKLNDDGARVFIRILLALIALHSESSCAARNSYSTGRCKKGMAQWKNLHITGFGAVLMRIWYHMSCSYVCRYCGAFLYYISIKK